MLAGWLDTCYYPSCSTTANERGEYDFAKLIAAWNLGRFDVVKGLFAPIEEMRRNEKTSCRLKFLRVVKVGMLNRLCVLTIIKRKTGLF